MRGLKKLLPLALAAVLLVMLLPVSADEVASRYGRTKLGEMTDGADLQYVYDQLVIGCADGQAQIAIDISGKNIDGDKLEMAYTMFYSDYPEYFWVKGGYTASTSQVEAVVTLVVEPEYSVPGSDLATAKTAYDAKVSALVSGLSGSDYDKAKTLHDRLIAAVTYEATANDQNAYGALVEGKAVCNGYARAYQHLLQKAGIEAWYVSGTSVSPAAKESVDHAWNLVKLDGQWYYTDVTWDDQGENTFYAYFNITTSQLLEDHVIGEVYKDLVPEATATAANLYVKEERVFAAYDRAKLAALLKKDGNKTGIYVSGDMDAFKTALDADLRNLGSALGATGSDQVSYNMSKLGKAMILQVVLVQEGHVHQVVSTVAKIEPTCMKSGVMEFYLCSCGLKFMDKACTKQITNSMQLEIRMLEHTPSDWEKTQSEHFKVCTVCGSEIENVRGAHSDKNEDKACDGCGYMMDGTATEETDATDTTTETTDQTTDQTTTEGTGTQTDPTEENKQETGGEDAPAADEPAKQDKKTDKSYILLIVAGVCGAGAAFVYFGWPKLWPKLKKYFKK